MVESPNDVIIEELGQSKDMEEESHNETLSKSKNNVNYRDDEQPKVDWPMAAEEVRMFNDAPEEPRQVIYAFLATCSTAAND